jgi:hypothetical protein
MLSSLKGKIVFLGTLQGGWVGWMPTGQLPEVATQLIDNSGKIPFAKRAGWHFSIPPTPLKKGGLLAWESILVYYLAEWIAGVGGI